MARKILLMAAAIMALSVIASRQRNQTSVAPGRWIERVASVCRRT
jgi:hypothetical protein